jgi:glutamate-1-semialdehyde 2,1-aminomutase
MYQAGTLSGNPIGMAAGIATLEVCSRAGFYEELSEAARSLAASLADSARRAGVEAQTGHAGGMLGMAFSSRTIRDFVDAQAADHGAYARFFHAMLERGVMLPPSGYEATFLSSAHDADSLAHIVGAAGNAWGSVRP